MCVYSASTTAPNPTISRMPEGVENPLVPDKEGDEVEIFSVLLLDENTFEGLAHSCFIIHTCIHSDAAINIMLQT